MRPLVLLVALLVGFPSRAAEVTPAPSTTATAVKTMDWVAVGLLSTGQVLRGVSVLDDDPTRAVTSPLFMAWTLTMGVGLLTGLVSAIVKSVMALSAPGSDVPGPFDLKRSPTPAGRALLLTGFAVAVAGLTSSTIGHEMVRGGAERRGAAGWLQAGGHVAVAAGLLCAMVGGELRDSPTVALAPAAGGALLTVGARW